MENGIKDNYEMVVRYDVNNLTLDDICVFTTKKELATGKIDNMPITVLGVDKESGMFRIKCESENKGLYYNGVVNMIRFNAIKNGWAYVILELKNIEQEEEN